MANDDANEIKLGVFMGFTGPLESLAPDIAAAAEMAMAEVTESGALLGGATVTSRRADTTAIDAAAAQAAAKVAFGPGDLSGIVGALTSGASRAILDVVRDEAPMVMVSPSASSGWLSGPEDDGWFFRTVPPELREAEFISTNLLSRGIGKIAIAHENTDYGKAASERLAHLFEESGGTVSAKLAYETGKSDYTSEAAWLAAQGGEQVVMIGFNPVDATTLSEALFPFGADGVYLSGFLAGNDTAPPVAAPAGWVQGIEPARNDTGPSDFAAQVDGAFDADALFAAEGYDAAALILLAMQAAGSSDPAIYKDVMVDVANGPGVPIGAGELALGLRILESGARVDYEGASGVDLSPEGDAIGRFRSVVFENGAASPGDPVRAVAGPEDDLVIGKRASETFKTGKGSDHVDGQGGRDVIFGGGGNDRLDGGAGRDVLKGGGGMDRLEGGRNGDKLAGGKSDDVLIGGGGADRFVFGKQDGFDVITDWQDRDSIVIRGASSLDELDISGAEAGTLISWARTSVLMLDTDPETLASDDFLFL